MAADSTKSTKIQHNNQGDTLTVASGGTLEALSGSTVSLAGSLTLGSATVVPALPTANGVYNLTVASGVATWTEVV